MDDHRKISLVTPCYNHASLVGQTMASVFQQGYPNLEYVVIDGGSTDGSADVIRRHEDQLAFWVSEPDGGQYDALNKGFAKTTGEIMGYLNADDLLMPRALLLVARIFDEFPEIEWLTGAHSAIGDRAEPIFVIPPARWSRWHILSDRMGRMIPQESTFWRRSLWERAGGRFDDRLKLAGDFELWARFARTADLHTVSIPIGCFRHVEGQRSVAHRDAYQREVAEVRRRELQASPAHARWIRGVGELLTMLRLGTRLRGKLDGVLGAPPPLAYDFSGHAFVRGVPTTRGRLARLAFETLTGTGWKAVSHPDGEAGRHPR